MYLWVAYDEEGLPIAVFDTAMELAVFMGVSHWTIYHWLEQENPQIARIRDDEDEDEEVTTEY